jgi:hypothetical protein
MGCGGFASFEPANVVRVQASLVCQFLAADQLLRTQPLEFFAHNLHADNCRQFRVSRATSYDNLILAISRIIVNVMLEITEICLDKIEKRLYYVSKV